MQKVEIILNGPEDEKCAELLAGLARETMKGFDVVPVKVYYGQNPARKGYGDLLVPEFMQGSRLRQRGAGGCARKM